MHLQYYQAPPPCSTSRTHEPAIRPQRPHYSRGVVARAPCSCSSRPPCGLPAAAAGLQAGLSSSSSSSGKLVERTYEHNWRTPLPDHNHPDPSCRPVLALGKFDALHKGHQALAAAALQLGGRPVLLSFSGMANVLGWPQRKPLVAPCDRARVLSLWAQQLAEQQQGQQQQQQQRGSKRGRPRAAAEAQPAQAPPQPPQQQQQGDAAAAPPPPAAAAAVVPVRQRYIPFAAVRSLSPQAFVDHIHRDFRAAGVVAGGNYRFGYKAAGDAVLLQQLCDQAGVPSAIVELVGAAEPGAVGPVSSSKIREMLDSCRIEAVRRSLGRPYRLVAEVGLADWQQPQQQQQQQPQDHGSSGSEGSSRLQSNAAAGAASAGGMACDDSSTSGGGTGSGGGQAGAAAVAAAQHDAAQRQWHPQRVFVPISSCLNQHPAPGVYLCSLQLFLLASGHNDLLQLQQAFEGAAAVSSVCSGNGSSNSRIEVLRSGGSSSSSSCSDCHWCVRSLHLEVEVVPDGLLLPRQVWEAAEACLNNSTSTITTSRSGSSPATSSRDPTCWDTDDNDYADDDDEGLEVAAAASAAAAAATGAGGPASALLVLDFESCLLQMCTLR